MTAFSEVQSGSEDIKFCQRGSWGPDALR